MTHPFDPAPPAPDDPDGYAGLLCARLCHDLISPAGAVGNGVELLQELGAAAGPELDLVARSAGQVTAALQFLRLAFGTAGADDRVSLDGLARTVRPWFDHQRPVLRWPETPADLTLREARLLANLLQIAVSVLPRGGEVAVEAAPGRLSVHAAGRTLLIPDQARDWLTDAPGLPLPSPRDLHWLVAARSAAACGLRLGIETADGFATLTARDRT